MNKLFGIFVSVCLVMSCGYALADEAVNASKGEQDQSSTAVVKVDDSEVKPNLGQEKQAPSSTPKSKLKKPRIGFKNNTVKPEDMKSYHRSESGDVSAQ
ncbi:MAG: hypothetical protein ACXWT7_03255 [Methylophilaceae bacterium]